MYCIILYYTILYYIILYYIDINDYWTFNDNQTKCHKDREANETNGFETAWEVWFVKISWYVTLNVPVWGYFSPFFSFASLIGFSCFFGKQRMYPPLDLDEPISIWSRCPCSVPRLLEEQGNNRKAILTSSGYSRCTGDQGFPGFSSAFHLINLIFTGPIAEIVYVFARTI